jgi:hypothetical protein
VTDPDAPEDWVAVELPYDRDERREIMAAGGDLFRPVETLHTTLDAPLQPDAFEEDA